MYIKRSLVARVNQTMPFDLMLDQRQQAKSHGEQANQSG
jgi:hypothetical protein